MGESHEGQLKRLNWALQEMHEHKEKHGHDKMSIEISDFEWLVKQANQFDNLKRNILGTGK